ncbi:coiled-coil domain-containing protein 122-like [Plectropomus leopardus]|uniref:coiled-coil domain-containing protein 122-like n=1 Tax=Plectropomus leopardus TaxID=160734 RepID=UPI001C4BA134|nr:coiled-coil domain-containing protein 122-like [Plectropomus leopardus]
MANSTASKDGAQEESGFSLTKAVEDVSQHGFAQTEALREKQKILISLQATLSDIEKKNELAERELRSNVRGLLMLEGEVEHLEQQTEVLLDRCASTCKENTELQIGINEEEESARVALERFNTYRKKMEGHRAAVLHAASQMEAHKDLEEKRKLVRMLRQKKEELKEDLENPNGNMVQMAKSEIEALKGEISVMRETVVHRRERLQEEFGTHTQIKKEIEIQNKRYKAIVKRLHCQLSKVQAAHRQMSEEVSHLERRLAELRGQLEDSGLRSQDSSASRQ